ncbi:uncharacterized protein [Littorina saxatilis]|uniref:Uncharacterized protein n=1 Tax=Littorina saxatilis TaxID=31220 RepID=A0AAN9GKG0_9CAEN
MFRGPDKDELRQQVAHVTLEMQKIQGKAQDLRNIFNDLEELYVEAEGCCFPFKYFVLKDLVHDAADVATNVTVKWYGSDNETDDKKKARGGVRRLLENCRELAHRMNQYEGIMEELSVLNKKGLEKALEERQTALVQEKLLLSQLEKLLQQLQDLHAESQTHWFWPRYVMLKRGVSGAIGAFRSVPGLSGSSSVVYSQGNDDKNSALQSDRTKGRV